MSSNLTPQVTLREAVSEDLEAIITIEQENFATEAAVLQTIRTWIEQISNICLIAELNNKIAGYIVGSAVFSHHLVNEMTDNSAEKQEKSNFITIQQLSIHPDFKGQGLQLVCSDDLISYYEMNAFVNEGISEKVYDNTILYELIWENSYFKEKK